MDRATRPEGSLADVQRGWDVYGADEQQVGTVRETGADHLVVRSGAIAGHDLTIPAAAIRRIEHDRVYLAVTKDAVAAQGWGPASPDTAGDRANAGDGPPHIPESIGTPGLTGVVEEGGKLVRAGSGAEAGSLETEERLGPLRGAPPAAGVRAAAPRREGAASGATERESAAPPAAGEQTLRLHKEELRVNKERVQTGEVQVHTRTVTELRTVQVPVQREELVIEREGEVTVVDADGNVQSPPAADQSGWQQRVRQQPALLFGLPGGLLLLLMVVLWRTGRLGRS